MKQSTLLIDYTTQTCIFNNVKISALIKEYSNLVTNMWISSNNSEFRISLTLGDHLEIKNDGNNLKLEFKNNYYFNEFLLTNENDLNQFKVSKINYIQIKGI